MLHFLSVSWPFPRQQKQELTFNRLIEARSFRLHFLKYLVPQKLSVVFFSMSVGVFKICESNKVCFVISRLNEHPSCIGNFFQGSFHQQSINTFNLNTHDKLSETDKCWCPFSDPHIVGHFTFLCFDTRRVYWGFLQGSFLSSWVEGNIPRETKDMRWGCNTQRLSAYTKSRNKLVVAISGQMVGASTPPPDIHTRTRIHRVWLAPPMFSN